MSFGSKDIAVNWWRYRLTLGLEKRHDRQKGKDTSFGANSLGRLGTPQRLISRVHCVAKQNTVNNGKLELEKRTAEETGVLFYDVAVRQCQMLLWMFYGVQLGEQGGTQTTGVLLVAIGRNLFEYGVLAGAGSYEGFPVGGEGRYAMVRVDVAQVVSGEVKLSEAWAGLRNGRRKEILRKVGCRWRL